ncbi:uncharacterized protein [Haliotis cracherodii]|uniref:uncharacterized protein n=1 Tax=Haliotis cracherodii TaxID=6455 RepID=UPI0039E7DA09
MYQTAEEMAHAGFVYTQSADGEYWSPMGLWLRQWASHDYPWVEHHNWSPNCDYLKLTGLVKHKKKLQLHYLCQENVNQRNTGVGPFWKTEVKARLRNEPIGAAAWRTNQEAGYQCLSYKTREQPFEWISATCKKRKSSSSSSSAAAAAAWKITQKTGIWRSFQ